MIGIAGYLNRQAEGPVRIRPAEGKAA